MSTVSEVLYVDESGDAALSKAARIESPFFALGFVYCTSPVRMNMELRRLLRRKKRKNHWPEELDEFKFYLPKTKLMKQFHYTETQVKRYESKLEAVRRDAIEIINTNADRTHGAVCEKKTVHTESFPSAEVLGNWLFGNTVCKWILPRLECKHPLTIIFDKGRLTALKSVEFKKYIKDKDYFLRQWGVVSHPNSLQSLKDQSSSENPGIWASDIVAGAFRHKYHAKDPTYADLLQKCEENYYFP